MCLCIASCLYLCINSCVCVCVCIATYVQCIAKMCVFPFKPANALLVVCVSALLLVHQCIASCVCFCIASYVHVSLHCFLCINVLLVACVCLCIASCVCLSALLVVCHCLASYVHVSLQCLASCVCCHAKIVPGENCTGRYIFGYQICTAPVQFVQLQVYRKTIKVPPALIYDCMVTAGSGIEVSKNSRGATKNFSSMPS